MSSYVNRLQSYRRSELKYITTYFHNPYERSFDIAMGSTPHLNGLWELAVLQPFGLPECKVPRKAHMPYTRDT